MLRMVILVAIVASIICSAQAATIYVPDHYSTIQGAINAAANGDEIIVRPGTYVENISFLGKAITLISEQGAAVTTISGGQAPRKPVTVEVPFDGDTTTRMMSIRPGWISWVSAASKAVAAPVDSTAHTNPTALNRI